MCCNPEIWRLDFLDGWLLKDGDLESNESSYFDQDKNKAKINFFL